MNQINCSQEFSLPTPDGTVWRSVAWDGCFYYVPAQCSGLIYQYNCSFECVGHFDSCRQYDCFCHDCASHCFWAASRTCPNTIFKLNPSLQEIDKIKIPSEHGVGGVVTGISYNCACHTLLVSFWDGVLSVDTANETATLLHKPHGGGITGILSVHPGYLVTQRTSAGQYVRLFNQCNCKIHEELIPCSLCVEQILYAPCHREPVFYSLITKKGCYPLIIRRCISAKSIGISIDCCYRECCKRCCSCAQPKPDGCHDDVSVIQSVALVEAALAHILNAEGEKLQKVLAETDDMHTIMCVNQQVTQTIIHATHLEQILYDKLSVLQNICCDQPCCE